MLVPHGRRPKLAGASPWERFLPPFPNLGALGDRGVDGEACPRLTSGGGGLERVIDEGAVLLELEQIKGTGRGRGDEDEEEGLHDM